MITGKDVGHYANLGRVRVSTAEKKKFAKDFEKILQYVKKLNEVDTEGIVPMNGGVLWYNQFRDDAVDLERKTEKFNQTAQTVRAFPETQDGYLKVPPIFTD